MASAQAQKRSNFAVARCTHYFSCRVRLCMDCVQVNALWYSAQHRRTHGPSWRGPLGLMLAKLHHAPVLASATAAAVQTYNDASSHQLNTRNKRMIRIIERTRIAQNLPFSLFFSILFITCIAPRIRPCVSSTSAVNSSSARPCALSSSLMVRPILPSRSITPERTPSCSSCCSIALCCAICCSCTRLSLSRCDAACLGRGSAALLAPRAEAFPPESRLCRSFAARDLGATPLSSPSVSSARTSNACACDV
mmetsp:Transcript_22917/g.50115  ORF Transcript_22917/g.50115 Transcript_22917/m.50115 type:complete len:251 (+) Transcript_22917:509-1261(+)